MRIGRWAVVVGFLIAGACSQSGGIPSSYPSGTIITPAHFRFATITEAGPGPDDGGWRAVCIHATLSQDFKGTATSAGVCDLEVGVPIQLISGRYISLHEAQVVAAEVANTAAYEVVTTAIGITAATCIRIRKQMEYLLRKQIPGSLINVPCSATIGTVPVPVVPFP